MTFQFITNPQFSIAANGLTAPVDVDGESATVFVPGVTMQVNDVVHLSYKLNDIPQGVYGVCTQVKAGAAQPNFVFKFDSKVYSLLADIPQNNVTEITVYRGSAYDKISQYEIVPTVTRAVYSDQLKSYNTTIDYNLTINQENRKFFSGFKSVVIADKILFADLCDNYAYGVSLSEATFNNINNVFSQAINFNIAKR
jgi:hypothetical protein